MKTATLRAARYLARPGPDGHVRPAEKAHRSFLARRRTGKMPEHPARKFGLFFRSLRLYRTTLPAPTRRRWKYLSDLLRHGFAACNVDFWRARQKARAR